VIVAEATVECPRCHRPFWCEVEFWQEGAESKVRVLDWDHVCPDFDPDGGEPVMLLAAA
jgi:hypothetical protein